MSPSTRPNSRVLSLANLVSSCRLFLRPIQIAPCRPTVKMSNSTVGNIYRAIIEEVIESSRTDFEEGGVEEGVLEDLRQVRCLSLRRALH